MTSYAGQTRHNLGPTDSLEGGAVIPGLTIPLEVLFG